MNTDSGLSNPEVRTSLAKKIADAESSDDLKQVLATVMEKEDFEHAKASLVLDTCFRMKRLTSREPKTAHGLIVDGMLDWCCKSSGDELAISKRQSHEFRNLLKSWLYQYSFEDCSPIRKAVLERLYEKLDEQPNSEQMWLAAAIGLRTNEIVERLEKQLWQPDKDLADSALFVLARLGVPPEKRGDILKLLEDRLSQGQIKDQRGVIVAIEELCLPSKPALVTQLLKVAEEELEERDIDFALCFGAASRVAERMPNNRELHREVWSVFKRSWRTMRMTPDYANSCNIEETLQDYIESLIAEHGEDRTIGDYISLSRISELISPNQLNGWNKVNLSELTPVLERLATLDTKIEGRFATTSLRLKKEAWHLALTAGIDGVHDWIDKAVLDETNPESSRQVSEIIACIRPSSLSERFLNEIRREPTGEEWTRHQGLIEIARSCGDEPCLDALLDFGLTKDGHVLLSTLHAIVDCALAQVRTGNSTVVQKVLDRTNSTTKRHREAAIAAFCELATEKGIVPKAKLARLWEFANNKSLDEYSRKRAYEAISFSDADVSSEQVGKLVELGQDKGELSWRACEVLIVRNLVELENEEWLQNKLRLSIANDRLEFTSDEEIPIWQAYLIGHLFRRKPKIYSDLVSKVIVSYSEKSLRQLLYQLEQTGQCPEDVAWALVQRIQISNSSSRTNVELFRILRIISPSKLFALAKLSEWSDWLPVARAAFAENIGKTTVLDTSHSNEAATLLLSFMRDAVYQVRRTAYRALALAQSSRLRSQCEVWSRTPDIEFRKRGAEAVSWISSDSFPDPLIAKYGFDWDPEHAVRETFSGTPQRRWRFAITQLYTKALLGECELESGNDADRYKYARALESLGDDETANQIHEFMTNNILTSHVGHLLERTEKEIRKNWKNETKKWPEPWGHETGFVEQISGKLIMSGREPFDAQFTLTCHHQKSPSELGDWSATAIVDGGPSVVGYELPDAPVIIKINNRKDAHAHAFKLGWIENSTKSVLTLGGGLSDYPSDLNEEKAAPTSLNEAVSRMIAYSNVQLKKALDVAPEKYIAEVVEKAEFDFFDPRAFAEPQLVAKQACQVSAVVLATIASLFEDQHSTSVLLWQISNEILGRKNLGLRLTPSEANTLQQVARTSDVASPDELLFWLIERVEDSQDGTKNARIQSGA